MRYEFFHKDVCRPSLVQGRKRHHLGLFQITVHSDTANHSLYPHILGRQAGQFHYRANRNRLTSQDRPIRAQTHLDELHFIPNILHRFVPLGAIAGGVEAGGGHVEMRLMSRFIQLRHILADHALAIELGAQVHQRLLHTPDPFDRYALVPSGIKQRDDFVFECRVDGAGVYLVLVLGIRFTVTDGPASGNLVRLIEPAVEDAQIEHTIDAGFHAAGAASLFSTARVVEPEVNTLHQLTADLDAIVLQKNDVFRNVGVSGKLDDFADQGLARQISRVSLTGNHDLHRHLAIGEQALQAIDIAEQQRGPLISGKATGKPDGQGVGVQYLGEPPLLGGRRFARKRTGSHSFPDKRNQVTLPPAMCFPKLLIGNVLHQVPELGVGIALAPVRLQVRVINLGEVSIEPSGQMHSVGDGGDGNLPNRKFRPQVLPHFLGNLAVQAAYGIAERGRFDGEDCHGEWFLLLGRLLPAERHKLLERDSTFGAIKVEVLVECAGVEQIDPGRHRGVGGENIVGAACFKRLFKAEFFLLNEQAHALDREKGRMPFVHVIGGRLVSQGPQRAETSDTEHDLLPDTGVAVSAIKLFGDLPVLRQFVLRDVGIQQKKLNPSDVDVPDFDVHQAARQPNRDEYIVTLLVAQRTNG